MIPETPVSARPIGGRFGRWIGAGLLVHFAVVLCIINLAREAPGEVLWLSHVSLLLAGLGLLLQSALPVTTALTTVGVLHGFWLVDSLSGLMLHWFPLGATDYLLTADRWTRVATAHHFYLAPLLFVIVWRHRTCPKATLPVASMLFMLLTLVSRVALSPVINVNYAFRVTAAMDHPLVAWVNSLSPVLYLFVINMLVTTMMFLPVSLLMHYRAQSVRTGETVPQQQQVSCKREALVR